MKSEENIKEITVITVTRGRPELLERAIESVRKQSYANLIEHFIYIDDCPETLEYLENNYAHQPNINWYYYKRGKQDVSGPSLLARLRNDAVARCTGRWLSYLDDDNEFDPTHIEKLYQYAKANNYDAVHSYVKVFNRNKTPYLFIDERWPWARSDKSKQKYHFMLENGLVEKGSNIRKYKYGIVIDTNVWLVKRHIWEECKIPDYFSEEDWENNLAEDDKLMEEMLRQNIPVHTNEEATVTYYLGGYSNCFDGNEPGTIVWEKVK